MKEGKNKIIILSVLIFILALLLSLHFIKAGKSSPNVQFAKSIIDDEENLIKVENIIKEILDEETKKLNKPAIDSTTFTYKIFNKLRDPFSFPKTKTPASKSKIVNKQQKTDVKQGKPKNKLEDTIPKLELKGIIFDKENPLAIINGAVYKEGDLIKSYRVVRITKDGVKLVSRNNQIYLKAPEFD